MKIKAGYYQFCPVYGNPKANLEKIIKKIQNVNNALIVLPELCFTGYNFVSKKELYSISMEIEIAYELKELEAICRTNYLYLILGVSERVGDRLFNSSVLIGPEGIIGKYRKTHLFYREKEIFEPGDTGFEIFDIGFNIGMMICFDWIFPESARTLALKGAHVIAHPANLVLPYCPEAMLYRSLENRVFTITSNRIGNEKNEKNDFTYIGQSQVVTPKAERLISASVDKEILELTEFDTDYANMKLINDYNDLFSDRREEYYK